MTIHSVVFIPVLFGFIGFVEPCSIGINILFLNRIQAFDRTKRISETVLFILVRGLFLALFGLSAAFIGSKFITIQPSFFLILGSVYILLGILAIVNMYRPIFTYEINISKYLQNKESIALGIVFGLIIPACAISLVLALIGKSILIGNLLEEFVSLFVFGVALSFPLVVITYFDHANEIIRRLSKKARQIPWLAGGVLIGVGVLTMLSSTWWTEAAR